MTSFKHENFALDKKTEDFFSNKKNRKNLRKNIVKKLKKENPTIKKKKLKMKTSLELSVMKEKYSRQLKKEAIAEKKKNGVWTPRPALLVKTESAQKGKLKVPLFDENLPLCRTCVLKEALKCRPQ